MKAKTRERNLVQDLGGWEGEEVTVMWSSCAVVTAVSQAKMLMCHLCEKSPPRETNLVASGSQKTSSGCPAKGKYKC